MESRFSQRLVRILIMFALVSFTAVAAIAQDDPDPNSPTPILLSVEGSTRALAQTKSSFGRVDVSRIRARAFSQGSKVVLYVTNLNLMDGEGANAFRVYAQDSSGRSYRFPVIDLQTHPFIKQAYAVTILVKDDLGFWEPPTDGGDMLVYLTWRGLASNSVKLGVGQMGGTVKDADGAKPTPISIVKSLPTAKDTGQTDSPNYVGYRWSGDRIRFLEQATFGPTTALDSRIRRIGLRTWLAEQFSTTYPSASNPYPSLALMPINPPTLCDGGADDSPPNCGRDHYSMYLPQTWFYKEALYGEPQLKHRVSWALNQLWVISGFDTQQSSHMIAYNQILSKNAFGNWRVLMLEMTLNPGMGNYLDMIRSTRTNPNENYPREILQLFNIGLFMLKPDGTLDCTEHPYPDPTPCQPTDTFIPTYDQNVVNNFTEVFTGWRDCRVTDPGPGCPNNTSGSPNFKDPMSLNPANHDLTSKTLLSYQGSTTTNIAACAGCTTNAQITPYANNSLNQALDNIYNHPNVAPFVSKYLIQQLVTSDPAPAYVGRISAVFNANRTNPSQLKEVVKAILLDPEARGDVKTDPIYGKLREPVQLMTNLFRQIGVTSANGLTQSDGDINRFAANMAQSLFFSPTVFNYYPPNYIVPGTALLGPEFAIFNTGTAISRANFGNSMVFGQINVSLPNTPNGTKLDFAELQALAAGDTTSNQLMDVLNQRMMHSTMSPQMRSTILTAVNAVLPTDPLTRAKTAVYLIVTSSQYQVQK